MARTLAQRENSDGFVKAGELIELRQSGPLTLHDRRVLNLLVRWAGPRIAEDVPHLIPMRELRGSHKGEERVVESIVRLMGTIVEIPTLDSKGRRATRRTQLLADTTTTDDESNPAGEVRYSFSRTMREIFQSSNYWGRIKPSVMFAFSSKYALTLYETLCLRRNLDKNEWEFSVEDFRQVLGVEDGKLEGFPQLKQCAITPAVEEINALSDFKVAIEPIRVGGTPRGKLVGFRVRWERKEPDEWLATLDELARPKAGRKARLTEGAGERRAAGRDVGETRPEPTPRPEAPRQVPTERQPPTEAQKAKAKAMVDELARKLKSVPG